MLNFSLEFSALGVAPSPSERLLPYAAAGMSAEVVRLAAVITPDVSPERRAVFLQTLLAAVADRNSNADASLGDVVRARELVPVGARAWDLDIWELDGEPETWEEQLRGAQSDASVFALFSGLGENCWEPVQEFCELNRLPCWLPSLAAAPGRADCARFSVYFGHDSKSSQHGMASVTTLHSWIESHGLPLADEAVQADVFIATQTLRLALAAMGERVSRKRLIERGRTLLQSSQRLPG